MSDAFDCVAVFVLVILATEARAAGEHRVHRNLFTGFDIRVSTLHDDTGEFMAHDDRRRVVGYVAAEGRQIGGTDTAQLHLDKHIPGFKRRDRLLLNTQLPNSLKNDGFHFLFRWEPRRETNSRTLRSARDRP